MRENGALSAAFDAEAFDILRRTPADLTLGGLTGGANPEPNALWALLPRETSAKLVSPMSAPGWMAPAAPTRTDRKQYQRRLLGSKLAQLALRVPSTTSVFGSPLVSVWWFPCVPTRLMRLRTNICCRYVRHICGTTGSPRSPVQPCADVMEARHHR